MNNKEFKQKRISLYRSIKKAYNNAYTGMAYSTQDIICTDDEWEDYLYGLMKYGYKEYVHTTWSMATFYFQEFQKNHNLTWSQMVLLLDELFEKVF